MDNVGCYVIKSALYFSHRKSKKAPFDHLLKIFLRGPGKLLDKMIFGCNTGFRKQFGSNFQVAGSAPFYKRGQIRMWLKCLVVYVLIMFFSPGNLLLRNVVIIVCSFIYFFFLEDLA